ncbi:MAG: hypothetical protein EZS28_056077 [Streblomastix strix]|uniref:Right handed beta helix domain-containing protein n=1 Tax=Streblomastix strix TaxID=222440 RepID=A0A5J4PS37_9EUKA|nr:MAG: hypothetical protein EZS28_056077 [Streblomastix strix]
MEFIDCIGGLGGGLYIWASQKLILVMLNKIIFQNCTGTFGGGMYMALSDISINIQITGELSFDNCSCTYYGGGMYITLSDIDTDVQITGELSFDNYSSAILGGGIYVSSSGSQLSFENKIQFIDCSSQNSGGGLYVDCYDEGTIRRSNLCLDAKWWYINY